MRKLTQQTQDTYRANKAMVTTYFDGKSEKNVFQPLSRTLNQAVNSQEYS